MQPCASVTPLRSFRIDLAPPPFQDASSVTVLIGYRDNLISLPGSGTAPAARVRSRPTGSTVTPNDLDYALRVVVSRAGGLAAGRLFIVDFDSCSGAPAPTTADLSCSVAGCSNSSGPIAGCTCSVNNP